jgi:hypothetical protein
MIRILLTATFVLELLPLPAGAQGHDHNAVEQKPSVGNNQVTNSFCPVTVDEPIDPTNFVEHEGQRFFFCCNRSKKQDPGLRTAYLSALVLKALFVGITGHLGGTLIHGTEHFPW